jgi:hypothetical protein
VLEAAKRGQTNKRERDVDNTGRRTSVSIGSSEGFNKEGYMSAFKPFDWLDRGVEDARVDWALNDEFLANIDHGTSGRGEGSDVPVRWGLVVNGLSNGMSVTIGGSKLVYPEGVWWHRHNSVWWGREMNDGGALWWQEDGRKMAGWPENEREMKRSVTAWHGR